MLLFEERGTRINGKLKKLQDLVPNMDKGDIKSQPQGTEKEVNPSPPTIESIGENVNISNDTETATTPPTIESTGENVNISNDTETATTQKRDESETSKKRRRPNNKKQKPITHFTKAASEESSLGKKFDPKEIRREIAAYFVSAELPFRHVEDDGFQRYTRYFYPTFEFPSRITVARDIYQLYLDEKNKLKKELKRHRVSLTTDCWTSIHSINYLCLIAHWVSNDWTMQKKILNFIQVPSHKGEMVGKELIACLHEWGIDKVFCVTVDNASSNDVALKRLKSSLQENNHGLVLNGEMFHMRCCAHILNLVVCDGLKEINHAISSIRNAVRYPMSSTEQLKRFKECCKEANIESRDLLCLDVSTRWDSTYLMLERVLKFKKAFEILDGDANYTKYFEEERVNGKGIEGPPVHDDWEKARVFVKCLKAFYMVTMKINGSQYVTSNLFFKEICEVQGNLRELGRDQNTLLGSMAISMNMKFDKYWGNIEKMNMLLYIATILDPRYKIKLLKLGFIYLYDEETSEKMLKHVEDTLNKLYNYYKEKNTAPNLDQPQPQEAIGVGSSSLSSLPCLDFHSFLAQKLNQDDSIETNDLEDYLTDRREKFVDESFDILLWWKANANRYKIVSQMAKDVLAIQFSTATSEFAFSTGGRILDRFRSSVSPKMVQALICTKNWLNINKEPVVLCQYMDEVEALEDSEIAAPDDDLCLTGGE